MAAVCSELGPPLTDGENIVVVVSCILAPEAVLQEKRANKTANWPSINALRQCKRLFAWHWLVTCKVSKMLLGSQWNGPTAPIQSRGMLYIPKSSSCIPGYLWEAVIYAAV